MTFEDLELPSNRRFGLFFAAILAALMVWRFDGQVGLGDVLLAASAVVLGLVAWLSPDLLAPFNRLWMRLGYVMGRIVSPIVLGVLFFAFITPIALLLRLFGRDELRLKMTPRDSHWKLRDPAGPEPSSFTRQY